MIVNALYFQGTNKVQKETKKPLWGLLQTIIKVTSNKKILLWIVKL